MNNIVIFPTSYLPTFEELQRLDNIQATIAGWRRDLRAEHEKRFFNAYQIMISRQNFHNGIRDNWKVYPGLKESIAIK